MEICRMIVYCLWVVLVTIGKNAFWNVKVIEINIFQTNCFTVHIYVNMLTELQCTD